MRKIMLILTWFMLGTTLIATLAAGSAEGRGFIQQSCNATWCPQGYVSRDDISRWMTYCSQYKGFQAASSHFWNCYEEQGSVTSDAHGYGVSPNYVCWKDCMKGRAGAMADKAICKAKCKGVPH